MQDHFTRPNKFLWKLTNKKLSWGNPRQKKYQRSQNGISLGDEESDDDEEWDDDDDEDWSDWRQEHDDDVMIVVTIYMVKWLFGSSKVSA